MGHLGPGRVRKHSHTQTAAWCLLVRARQGFPRSHRGQGISESDQKGLERDSHFRLRDRKDKAGQLGTPAMDQIVNIRS